MSPRTTLVLLVLLALAGGAIFWLTRGDGGPPPAGGRRLMPGLLSGDVSEIAIRAERKDTEVPGEIRLVADGAGGWTVKEGDGAPRRARGERVRGLLEALRETTWIRQLTSASKDALARHGLAQGQRVLVDLAMKDGTHRNLELGAVVSEGGVAARVDGSWPPVEVDRQILDDVAVAPSAWLERRLAPFDSSTAQSVRVTFPGSAESSFLASRESDQWAIREPALQRADQAAIARLLASISGIEGGAPYGGDSRPDPAVLVRYEVQVSGRATPIAIEFGEGHDGDLVPARAGGDKQWTGVSLEGLELVTRPAGEFRSRRLLDVDTADVQEVDVAPGGLHLGRGAGGRLFFRAPDAWGWKLLNRPRRLPLDASAQADWLQGLSEMEAADFAPGEGFDPDLGLTVESGAAGAPRTVAKLRFGKDDGGTRVFSRGDGKSEGHVRSSSVAFLTKPYWKLLARQAYSGAWWSFTRIEVEEVGKRKAVIDAVSTAGKEPDFVVTEPATAARAHVPRELSMPVTDKLALLTVDSFAGHGDPKEFGLDKPQFVIRWIDSGQSQGTPPDLKNGQTVTWRVGGKGHDGMRPGDLDIQPGLIMKTDARDLDPFINLLEWVARSR